MAGILRAFLASLQKPEAGMPSEKRIRLCMAQLDNNWLFQRRGVSFAPSVLLVVLVKQLLECRALGCVEDCCEFIGVEWWHAKKTMEL